MAVVMKLAHGGSGPEPLRDPPVFPEARSKGWKFQLDYERIEASDTWAIASPMQRPWLLMLWLAAWRQWPCGSLPNDDQLIAARIGMPPEDFASNRSILMRGWWLATDGRFYHDAIAEQATDMLARRDADRERQADWRAKNLKQAKRDVTEPSNVTEPSKAVTRDTNVNPAPVPVPVPVPVPRKPTKQTPRGTRLPDNWMPSPELIEWAEADHPEVDLHRAVPGFRDYWGSLPGHKALRTDWGATFRNWVRNERVSSKRPYPVPTGPNKQAALEDRNRAAAEAFLHGVAA